MKLNTKRVLLFAAATIALALVLSFMILRDDVSGPRSTLPTGTHKPIIALGDSHGVILAGDGSLWTWGDCELGWHTLGFGTNITNQPSIRRLGTDTNWVYVAVGGSTTIALKSDGSIWGWGYNGRGQISGDAPRDVLNPTRSAPGNDWKQVASSIHTLALKRDGTLWAWGDNWAGVFGDGTTNSSRTPSQVDSSTNWSRIWAGSLESVGQQNDGSLWWWGWDYSKGSNGVCIPVPTRVSRDTNWIDVGIGEWMVFAIKSDGTLWAWGRRAHIYSNATNTNQDSNPVQVGHDTDWRSCANFGSPSPLFMKRDGSLWCLNASDERGLAVVTKLVQAMIINDQINAIANNNTLGGDPSYGVVKALQVNYQLDGTNAVAAFRENSPFHLGVAGKPLKITRVLYGDPKLFAEADQHPEKDLFYQPAHLRRIELNKNIVAFCGGRHGLGVALTADGEVWQWGELLARSKPAPFPLSIVAKILRQFNVKNSLDRTTPLTFDRPIPLDKAPAN